jgi:hypothetical protein
MDFSIILTTINENKSLYILKAGLISFIGAVAFGFIVTSTFDFSSHYTSDFSGDPFSIIDFFGYVIFAPLVETAMMIPIIKLIRCVTVKFWAIVLLSAVVWSCLHSLLIPVWGIFTFIGFVIFSIAYLTWEKRSTKYAFWITVSIHSLHNLLACTMGMLAVLVS